MAQTSDDKGNSVFPDIEIPEHVYCPICQQIMKNPVQLNGMKQYTFCGFCISQWLNLKKSNPMTNESLTDVVLIPDKHLNFEIKQLYERAKAACYCIIVTNTNHNEAIAAKQWFDDKLVHLESSYEWTPWMKETAINAIRGLMYVCNSCSEIIYAESKEEEEDNFVDVDLNIDDDMEKEVIIECIESVNQDAETWKSQIEQIRAEGKRIIDDKCNETITKIETLSSKDEKEKLIQECQNEVGFISSIIEGIGNAIKSVSGWLSEFLMIYIRRILYFLGGVYFNNMVR